MARRKDDSLHEVFNGLFMRIPPWTCIPIAIVAYGVVAGAIAVFASSNKILAGLANTGPLAGGFIALLILLAGVKAYVERIARQKLLAKQTGIESIRSVSWSQFELLIGQIYRQQSYEVVETGGGCPDGGIDLKLRKDGLTTIVQCKQWKIWKVGVGPIRELYGVMVAARADRAIFVTSGVFTNDAKAFAAGKPMELVDGTALLKLVAAVRGEEPAPIITGQAQVPDMSSAPACPQCGGSMILRTAKRGAKSGSQFWGCAGYPRCRVTRNGQIG